MLLLLLLLPQVLREVLSCHLPIELVWHTREEIDTSTLTVLQDNWGPIIGVDLSRTPWPAHHRQLPQPTQNSGGHGSGTGEMLEQDVLPAE